MNTRNALRKSFQDEYNKLKIRKSVWLESPTGWFHSYNKEIVKMKLESLSNMIYYLGGK